MQLFIGLIPDNDYIGGNFGTGMFIMKRFLVSLVLFQEKWAVPIQLLQCYSSISGYPTVEMDHPPVSDGRPERPIAYSPGQRPGYGVHKFSP